MKAKTIKKVLQKKHKDFYESIEDTHVRKLVKKNSIITGGSIVSMLLGEEVNDYDYYFTDKETALAVSNYYVDKFNKDRESSTVRRLASVMESENRVRIMIKSEGIAGNKGIDEEGNPIEESEESEEQKFKPIFLSENAITLSGKVQLVVRFFGDAEEIHTNYDFKHATCWWTSADNHLELPQEALEAIITKELVYQGSKYPLASIFRTKKFIQRGWHINAGQYLKMVFQLNDMDLTNLDVLREQLTGVDALYFFEIIEIIQNREPEIALDSAYVMEVIDRVFG